MGDFVGHPFRGNQWTDGSSVHEGKGSSPRFADDDWAQRGTPPGHTARIDPATGRVVIEKNTPTATNDGSSPTTDDNPTGRFTDKNAQNLANYERIIARQDYESAAVTDTYGNVVFSKDGASDHVSFTPDEADLMRGSVLTHNHPSNGAFSDDDVLLFFARGLKEIRAVGRKGSMYRLGVKNDFIHAAPFTPSTATMIHNAFRAKMEHVRTITRGRINRGEITVDEANAGASDETHKVLMQLAKDYSAYGLYYKRRK